MFSLIKIVASQPLSLPWLTRRASDPEAPPETWRSYRQILQEGFQSIDRRLQEYGPLEPERFSLEEATQRLARHEDLTRWRRV